MEVSSLLEKLGYRDSPHFLRRESAALRNAPVFGHVFRKAESAPCHLQGVYTLRQDPKSKSDPLVPVAYVCRAKSDEDANKIHRLVWNQDVVPFLLVSTPHSVRFYSGFRHDATRQGAASGLLRVVTKANELSDLAETLGAESINSGLVWGVHSNAVSSKSRVDWRLLASLSKLDQRLRTTFGIERSVSHALIGKYVYLHYLRDREILSDERLKSWNLGKETIFGRTATRSGLAAVNQRLDEWLNGSVFPLALRGSNAPDDEVIARVAGTFSGDQPVGDESWQLHLDFPAYDFSYIPIETLSVIYEQFLHAPNPQGGKSQGEEKAAYYTPIPVVNFMLAEMDAKHPLQQGMKVFDPSCGSGAFLVQSYRRLIEREYPATRDKKPTPKELRELLVNHIFGVDVDPDACRVTELSLLLTLLDYVDPPDLLPMGRFKLPTLRDQNIFHTNFFKFDKPAKEALSGMKFDWIVGNPPWKRINPGKLANHEPPVWEWMNDKENRKHRPCGGNQPAQAFSWRVGDFLEKEGAVSLLVPAMTLFDSPSQEFRAKFFRQRNVSGVANFANLAEMLFAGRARVPAAAIFFSNRANDLCLTSPDESIAVFSPLVANQDLTRTTGGGTQDTTWALTFLASELRSIATSDAATGDALPWKIAAWGSRPDCKLLDRTRRRHTSIDELETSGKLIVSEGIQLRNASQAKEPLEELPEVVGKTTLEMAKLDKLRNVFSFPDDAQSRLPPEMRFVRKRGGKRAVLVCRPPHIVVSAARTFAVYSDEFLIVPPRQIGIASTATDAAFLKALSLYLSSDFAFYHQFFTSTQFGVQRGRGTLEAIRELPIPEDVLRARKPWQSLHRELSATSPITVSELRASRETRGEATETTGLGRQLKLIDELNELVYDALGFDDRERVLVRDFVRVRYELNDGKVGEPAVRPPTNIELKAYGRRLKLELDAFLGEESGKHHRVSIVHDRESSSGMVEIALIPRRENADTIAVFSADDEMARQLSKVRRRLLVEHAQWVYFDRNLRVYEGNKTYTLKPLQRFHWLESQAMQDAADIIAETLQQSGNEESIADAEGALP